MRSAWISDSRSPRGLGLAACLSLILALAAAVACGRAGGSEVGGEVEASDTEPRGAKSEPTVIAPELTPPSYVMEWGGFGKLEGKFQFPQKMTIDPDGNLVVADAGNNRIQIFDTNGQFLRAFGTPGEDPGEFFNPGDVAVDNRGDYLIADFHERRFQLFTSDGTFKKAFRASTAVAYAPTTDVFFALDMTDHIVYKATPDFEILMKWGGFGSGPGQFQFPKGLAIDGDRVIVADMVGQRVQIFDQQGNYIEEFGTFGSGPGEFHNPYEVSVDSSHRIYVADMNNHRVQVFSPHGAFLTKFGGFGSAPGEMKYPTGLAIDSSGTVFVVDGGNHRIQKFTAVGS